MASLLTKWPYKGNKYFNEMLDLLFLVHNFLSILKCQSDGFQTIIKNFLLVFFKDIWYTNINGWPYPKKRLFMSCIFSFMANMDYLADFLAE